MLRISWRAEGETAAFMERRYVGFYSIDKGAARHPGILENRQTRVTLSEKKNLKPILGKYEKIRHESTKHVVLCFRSELSISAGK